MKITCGYCGKVTEKRTAEITRQKRKGRTLFFCNLSCAAKYKYKDIQETKPIICDFCGGPFDSKRYQGKWSKFCSRECASAGSVTDFRREITRQTAKETIRKNQLRMNAAALRKREWDKYKKLSVALNKLSISHQFECPFKDYPPDEYTQSGIIVDLVLFDLKIAIEFDEEYHHAQQKEYDRKRDQYLISIGYETIRYKIKEHACIPIEEVIQLVRAR